MKYPAGISGAEYAAMEEGYEQGREAERAAAEQRGGEMVRIEGYVYCHELTEVHEDSLNPYGMGPESHCKATEHRPIYYRARKGDLK